MGEGVHLSRKGKHMSVRERRRHKALCKLFRRLSLPIALLVAKREHFQGLMRVKALQVQKAKIMVKRGRVRRAVQLGGPRALEKGQAARKLVLQEEGRAIAEFWKSLWQVVCSYTHGHPDIRRWQNGAESSIGLCLRQAKLKAPIGARLGGLRSASSQIGRLRGQME